MRVIYDRTNYMKEFEVRLTVWICPKCGSKQSDNLNWCGKNLTCGICGAYSYYKEWTTE